MESSPSILPDPLDGPSLMAPPGVQYNFVNPPDFNTAWFTILGIALFVTTFAFCIRMYTSRFILRDFYLEDYLLLIGYAFYCVFTAVAFKVIFVHAGIHQWDIQAKNIGTLLYWINTEDIIYCCAIPFIKASILFQYLRIFRQAKKASFMYIGCWAIFVSLVIFSLVGFFVLIFACTPRKKTWNPLIEGSCRNTELLNNATGVYNLFTDIILVLLPQHEIWKLHMNARKKVAVSAIFLVALCAVISSAFRLYYSVKLAQTGDVSYYVAFQGIWATCENSIGIICCCLPVCPKFFQIMGPKMVSLYKGSTIETPFRSKSIAKKPRKHTNDLNGSDSISNALSGPRSQVQGPYENLEDGHELLRIETKRGEVSTTGGGLYGHNLNDGTKGIRVVQTYEVELEHVSSQG